MEKMTVQIDHNHAVMAYIMNETHIENYTIQFVWLQNKLYKYTLKGHQIIKQDHISNCSLEECINVFI